MEVVLGVLGPIFFFIFGLLILWDSSEHRRWPMRKKKQRSRRRLGIRLDPNKIFTGKTTQVPALFNQSTSVMIRKNSL